MVFISIFGSGYDAQKFSNACATRVALALLSGGVVNVTKRERITEKTHKYYGHFIEPGANNMKDFLIKIWGQPEVLIKFPVTLEKVQKALNGKKGIYIMIPKYPSVFGATGHATLWTGKRVIGDNYYISENTHAVYFWELK